MEAGKKASVCVHVCEKSVSLMLYCHLYSRRMREVAKVLYTMSTIYSAIIIFTNDIKHTFVKTYSPTHHIHSVQM
jgi:hypothetical protein